MEQLKGYTLTINGREDLSESITGESVGLYAEFDDTLDKASPPRSRWTGENTGLEKR